MTGAVCPACGVAVVPGYVRCPKCHAPLPRIGSHMAVGGTALEERPRRFPLVAVVIAALIGAGVIIALGVCGGGKSPQEAAKATPPEVAPTAAAPTPTAAPAPVAEAPAKPAPGPIASRLEQQLNRQRLWSSVEVSGGRVDVRSGSCSDPAMTPMLDGAVPAFKAAGLTKLRCLEQSGRVVTDRDL